MLNKLLSFLYDALIYGAGGMIGQVISFILLPVYTRYLTPEDYGILAMAVISGALFNAIANLGMTNAIFRYYNLCKDNSEKKEVISAGLIGVTASSVLLAIAVWFASEPISNLFFRNMGSTRILAFVVATAVINTVNETPIAILRADRRVKTISFINILTILVSIGVSIFFVVYLKVGLIGVIFANFAGSIISFITLFAATIKSISFKMNFDVWKKMLSYGIPIVPHRVQAIGLAQFSQYLIAHKLGMEEAGVYNIAIKIVTPITFIIGAAQRAWVPFKFQLHAQEDSPQDVFRSMITYYVAGISALWLWVSLFGPEIINIMTTEKFHAAVPFIPLVALVFVSQGLYFMFGTGFEFADNTKPLPLISIGGLVVVIISAVFLIPLFGGKGAAIASILGWFVMTILIYYFSQRRFPIDYDWQSLCCFFLFSVLFVLIGSWTQTLPVLPRIVISLLLSLVYPILILCILYRSPFERERIVKIRAIFKEKCLRY